jgi:hypothetical protein
MQTNQPLSQQDLVILNTLRYTKKISAVTGIIVGLGLALAGTIMLCTMWEETSNETRFTIVGSLILGFLVLSGAIKLYVKNRELDIRPSHNQMKQVYSGVLTHTEVVKERYVRYHFNGFTIDAWIAAATGNPPGGFLHTRDIKKFATRTNVPVTLSVALLEPGVNVILAIDYDQQYYVQSIQSMDVDKFVIKTIVNEVLTLREETSDSTDVYHFLRLGNGMLTDVTFNKTGTGGYTVGDEVVLDYLHEKKGGKNVLLGIRKVAFII